MKTKSLVILPILVFFLVISTNSCKKEKKNRVNPSEINQIHVDEKLRTVELAKVSINPISELDDQNMIQQQLSYMSGGAGYCSNYGQDCIKSIRPGKSLYIGGVYSFKDQFDHPWWGTKTTSCKEIIELGDMVVFLVRGFNIGESVEFILNGPRINETYKSKVVELKRVDVGCEDLETYSAAELSWLASPEYGVGNYKLTAVGSIGSASMEFTVKNNEAPNFGLLFGNTGRSLYLQDDEKIKLVIAGYTPNKKVTALIFKYEEPNIQVLKGYFDIKTNEKGDCVSKIDWPSFLISGNYSIVIPEMIPQKNGDSNALGAIEFYVKKNDVHTNYIQIGSFANKDNADALIGKVSKNIKDIFIYNEKSGNQELYKVRIPVFNEAELNELVERLKSEGFHPFIVRGK